MEPGPSSCQSAEAMLYGAEPQLVEHIANELKSQGLFDAFRRECHADVDTKPAYQNLKQKVEAMLEEKLKQFEWCPDTVKNHVREELGYQMDREIRNMNMDRFVNQVIHPKVYTEYIPQIERAVYSTLGIEKPITSNGETTTQPEDTANVGDSKGFLSDLEPISPVKLDFDEFAEVGEENKDSCSSQPVIENNMTIPADPVLEERNQEVVQQTPVPSHPPKVEEDSTLCKSHKSSSEVSASSGSVQPTKKHSEHKKHSSKKSDKPYKPEKKPENDKKKHSKDEKRQVHTSSEKLHSRDKATSETKPKSVLTETSSSHSSNSKTDSTTSSASKDSKHKAKSRHHHKDDASKKEDKSNKKEDKSNKKEDKSNKKEDKSNKKEDKSNKKEDKSNKKEDKSNKKEDKSNKKEDKSSKKEEKPSKKQNEDKPSKRQNNDKTCKKRSDSESSLKQNDYESNKKNSEKSKMRHTTKDKTSSHSSSSSNLPQDTEGKCMKERTEKINRPDGDSHRTQQKSCSGDKGDNPKQQETTAKAGKENSDMSDDLSEQSAPDTTKALPEASKIVPKYLHKPIIAENFKQVRKIIKLRKTFDLKQQELKKQKETADAEQEEQLKLSTKEFDEDEMSGKVAKRQKMDDEQVKPEMATPIDNDPNNFKFFEPDCNVESPLLAVLSSLEAGQLEVSCSSSESAEEELTLELPESEAEKVMALVRAIKDDAKTPKPTTENSVELQQSSKMATRSKQEPAKTKPCSIYTPSVHSAPLPPGFSEIFPINMATHNKSPEFVAEAPKTFDHGRNPENLLLPTKPTPNVLATPQKQQAVCKTEVEPNKNVRFPTTKKGPGKSSDSKATGSKKQQQHYLSCDLYKPRPTFTPSRRQRESAAAAAAVKSESEESKWKK